MKESIVKRFLDSKHAEAAAIWIVSIIIAVIAAFIFVSINSNNSSTPNSSYSKTACHTPWWGMGLYVQCENK